MTVQYNRLCNAHEPTRIMTSSTTKSTPSLSQWLSLIDALLHQNELDAAAGHVVALVKAHPLSAAAWNRLSVVSFRLNRHKLALDAGLKSLECEPKNTTSLLQCSRCFISQNQFENAIKALTLAQSIIEQSPQTSRSNAEELCELGSQLFSLGQIHSALACYKLGLESQPNHRTAKFNVAMTNSHIGKFDEAEQYYLDLLKDNPRDYLACYHLAQLPKLKSTNTAIALLNECLELNNNSEAKIVCAYGLAKLYEQQGDFDLAFQQMQRGAKEKRATINYQLKTELDLFSFLTQAFAKNGKLSEHTANTKLNPSPIFIVGLPRTGTTLLERMLASHSRITSGGELPCLPQAIMAAAGINPGADPFSLTQTDLKNITTDKMQAIGKAYRHFSLARIKSANNDPKNPIPSKLTFENTDAQIQHYYIDKLPFNSRFIGFIAHAIPSAKIIFVNRDPLDSGLSNFKMLFSHGYGYSYDQTELADFIAAHQKMMDLWKQQFPGLIHTVEYEQLVTNPQCEINAALDYLNLKHEPECLAFDQNQAPSLTASANQIRQPVYTTSVGNWRHYRCHLTPLITRLKNNGLLSHLVD